MEETASNIAESRRRKDEIMQYIRQVSSAAREYFLTLFAQLNFVFDMIV
jgi:hypothetical protein